MLRDFVCIRNQNMARKQAQLYIYQAAYDKVQHKLYTSFCMSKKITQVITRPRSFERRTYIVIYNRAVGAITRSFIRVLITCPAKRGACHVRPRAWNSSHPLVRPAVNIRPCGRVPDARCIDRGMLDDLRLLYVRCHQFQTDLFSAENRTTLRTCADQIRGTGGAEPASWALQPADVLKVSARLVP